MQILAVVLSPISPHIAQPLCRNNQSSTGNGIEKHQWSFDVDLNITSLRQFKNCGTLRINTQECCRNSNITTGASNQLFFTYLEIDLTNLTSFNHQNTSPSYHLPPIFQTCCNQPLREFVGAIDPDTDSVSINFGHPLRGYNANIGYTAGTSLAYNHPFNAYYFGNITPPTAYPNGLGAIKIPIGIYLDQKSGMLIATPTDCQQRTAFVIEIKEWRKDTTGNYKLLSTVRRDLQMETKSCSGIDIPQLQIDDSLVFYEGVKNCINIGTSDSNAMDTLTLSAYHHLSGTEFYLKDSSEAKPTGTFCVTPPANSASSIPFKIAFRVEDRTCSVVSQSSKSVLLYVQPYERPRANISEIECGKYEISYTLHPKNSLELELGAFSGDSTSYYFYSTKGKSSTSVKDTIGLIVTDTFLISQKLNLGGNNFDSWTDTFFHSNLLNLHSSRILLEDVSCPDYKISFEQDTAIRLIHKEVLWSLSDISGNATFDKNVIYFKLADATQSNLFQDTLAIYDNLSVALNLSVKSAYCENNLSDTIIHFSKDLFTLNPSNDTALCPGTSIQLMAVGNDSDLVFQWRNINNNQILDTSESLTHQWIEGDRIIEVTGSTTRNCQESQLIKVNQNPDLTRVLDQGYAVCLGDTLVVPFSESLYKNVNWGGGNVHNQYPITSQGSYTVNYQDTNNCNYEGTFLAVFQNINKKEIKDTVLCGDSIILSIVNYQGILWNTGSTNRNLVVKNSGTYYVTKSVVGCTYTDTAQVTLLPIPSISLGNDTVLCAENIVIGIPPRNKVFWNTSANTDSILVTTSGKYTSIVTNSDGCTSEDSINITLNQNKGVLLLTRSNDTLYSSQSGSHLWYRDGVLISGNNSNQLKLTGKSIYSVVFIDSNGCSSDTSFYDFTANIISFLKSNISIYPNPSRGAFNLSLGKVNVHEINRIEMMNSLGQKINFESSTNDNELLFQINERFGLYFLRIHTKHGVITKEFQVMP